MSRILLIIILGLFSFSVAKSDQHAVHKSFIPYKIKRELDSEVEKKNQQMVKDVLEGKVEKNGVIHKATVEDNFAILLLLLKTAIMQRKFIFNTSVDDSFPGITDKVYELSHNNFLSNRYQDRNKKVNAYLNSVEMYHAVLGMVSQYDHMREIKANYMEMLKNNVCGLKEREACKQAINNNSQEDEWRDKVREYNQYKDGIFPKFNLARDKAYIEEQAEVWDREQHNKNHPADVPAKTHNNALANKSNKNSVYSKVTNHPIIQKVQSTKGFKFLQSQYNKKMSQINWLKDKAKSTPAYQKYGDPLANKISHLMHKNNKNKSHQVPPTAA